MAPRDGSLSKRLSRSDCGDRRRGLVAGRARGSFSSRSRTRAGSRTRRRSRSAGHSNSRPSARGAAAARSPQPHEGAWQRVARARGGGRAEKRSWIFPRVGGAGVAAAATSALFLGADARPPGALHLRSPLPLQGRGGAGGASPSQVMGWRISLPGVISTRPALLSGLDGLVLPLPARAAPKRAMSFRTEPGGS